MKSAAIAWLARNSVPARPAGGSVDCRPQPNKHRAPSVGIRQVHASLARSVKKGVPPLRIEFRGAACQSAVDLNTVLAGLPRAPASEGPPFNRFPGGRQCRSESVRLASSVDSPSRVHSRSATFPCIGSNTRGCWISAYAGRPSPYLIETSRAILPFDSFHHERREIAMKVAPRVQ
jgi:hypothetical protein